MDCNVLLLFLFSSLSNSSGILGTGGTLPLCSGKDQNRLFSGEGSTSSFVCDCGGGVCDLGVVFQDSGAWNECGLPVLPSLSPDGVPKAEGVLMGRMMLLGRDLDFERFER